MNVDFLTALNNTIKIENNAIDKVDDLKLAYYDNNQEEFYLDWLLYLKDNIYIQKTKGN